LIGFGKWMSCCLFDAPDQDDFVLDDYLDLEIGDLISLKPGHGGCNSYAIICEVDMSGSSVEGNSIMAASMHSYERLWSPVSPEQIYCYFVVWPHCTEWSWIAPYEISSAIRVF